MSLIEMNKMIKSSAVAFQAVPAVPGLLLLDSLEIQKDRNEKSPGDQLSLKPEQELRKDGVKIGAIQISEKPARRTRYSVFTSGAYSATAPTAFSLLVLRATAPNAAFPQEKPHFAALSCSE